ncbi:hypothetical protein TrVGV298_000781 [Trichoderma virens]|nr:hypothetical protein TrVGV298_000781 [Trichoderma virens]
MAPTRAFQGGEYGTALHAAAASHFPDEAIQVMKLLLDHGAKVDQPGGDRWGTALQVACREGTIEAVRFLLDHGADVNAEGGSQFSTSLQAAAGRTGVWYEPAKLQIMEMLINNGAEVNQQSGECGTALQTACLREESVPVLLLLENGADVNARGGRHGTALMAACTWSYAKRVRLLLDRGADVNAQTEEHGTALMVACEPKYTNLRKANMEVVRLLLDRGADVNAQGGKYGTALSAACRGDSELAQLLLVRGADVHLQDCAAWHSAALCKTSKYLNDNDNVLRLLLGQDGIDVNHMHEEYGSALHTMMSINHDNALEDKVAMQEWRKGVDVLLEHSIDANAMNERLGSALHVACAAKHDDRHKDIETVCWSCTDANFKSNKTKYLLDQCPDINVNAQGGAFGSALQAAAYSGQTLSVRLLLDRKADVNARSGKYRSPLNGAVISGYWDIVEILLEAGATPDCHLQEQPDEEWVQTVFEEHGRGAVERYRKFWEVEMENKVEGI